MTMPNAAAKLIAISLLLASTASSVPAGVQTMTFAEAQQEASARELPVLVDFFADWCGPCKRFDADLAKPDSPLVAAFENVVFISIDAEKGEGLELAKAYEIVGYPTYVLMDAAGDVIDRWAGYGGTEDFLGIFEIAVADPLSLEQKRARYAAEPNAADAQRFARVAMGSDDYDAALAYYAHAQELDPGLDLASDRFWAGYYSRMRGGDVDTDGLRALATALTASPAVEADELASVAMVMTRLARKERADFHVSFLEAARARSSEMSPQPAAQLDVLVALHVDDDPARAAELKKSTMSEGWIDDPDALNAYAWWCFENQVNLEQAETLARKGVELATPGKQKAMILDTAAEICNARGNCRDAVTLMELAIAEAPDSEHYQKQLERFQKILASTE